MPGIRTKTQREHQNSTEFVRNHSGSIETQRNSREFTTRASKPRPRLTARAVAVDPPRRGLKRLREAGIRAKPQWGHRNATEFARIHSGNIETQWNSCENTAGASNKAPSHRARHCGRQPISSPPRRGLKRPREVGIRAKSQWEHRIEMQWNSCETTMGASKRNGIREKPQWERRNQGPVPPPRAPLRSTTNSFILKVRTPLCKHCLGNKEIKKVRCGNVGKNIRGYLQIVAIDKSRSKKTMKVI